MKTTNLFFLLIALSMPIHSVNSQSDEKAYLNPSLSFEERVGSLISQMTLEEKISQLVNSAKAIHRLDIPAYDWWNESLHGVAFSGKATVFPQPIGLGASFNASLVKKIAEAISDEARAKNNEYLKQGKRGIFQGLTFFAPNINIFRDPRWGRGSETYGEDPYLTGRLGVAYIQGLQGNDPKYLKLVATPKHYAVHSAPEATRHSFNSIVSDKDLYETYLPHFKEAIKEGKAFSIMSAYNRVNGQSASGDPRLLTEILRNEWGFDGYVVSDCGAINDIFENHKIAYSKESAAALGLTSGCDLECGSYYTNLTKAYSLGLITDQDLNTALKRVFMARFKLGMFDPPAMVPFTQIPLSVINSPANQQLALDAARESIVLLKNENNLLPLTSKIKTIGVIGPNSDQVTALLGNYHGLPFQYSTPLNGIRKNSPKGTKVLYAQGCDWKEGLFICETLPAKYLSVTENGKTTQGLKGEYFPNDKYTGTPFAVRTDKELTFNWDEAAPMAGMPDDYFSIRWTGVFTADKSGDYVLGAEGHNIFNIYLNDSLFVKHYEGYHENIHVVKSVHLNAGETRNIRIEFAAHSGAANFRLIWVPVNRDLENEALAVAEKSDVVVMCMGITPRLEAEGQDRTTIMLPDVQQKLIKTIAKTGKPIVLVLMNGGPLSFTWEKDNIQALIEAWYPGQAGGDAIADVIFGKYNPSGRLPLTFYNSLEELPQLENYAMKGRTYRYFNGEPLFSFGYGLSFSNFEYKNISINNQAKVGEMVKASVDIKNTSKVEGTEVVQLYIKNLAIVDNQPRHSLKGVQKIVLKPGETKTVNFEINPGHFAYFNNKGKAILEPGKFGIYIGGLQPGYEAPTTSGLLKELVLTGQ